MADKTIGFNIVVEGVSNEANELAKLELQLKNIKKERDELIKQTTKSGHFTSQDELRKIAAYNKELEKQTTTYKNLKKEMELVDGSVNKMRYDMKKLKDEYYATGDGAIRQSLLPQINKLQKDISNAEQAIGVHSRGVGNYKNSILQAGKELVGFAGFTAMAATALSKLKDAFVETEIGAKVTKQWTEAVKTFFQSIVTGQAGMAVSNALAASEVAKIMNEIRIGDRRDLVEIKKRELELNDLRLKTVDTTRSATEQLHYQNLASQKENELIEYKIKDKEEELLAVRTMLTLRSEDTVLLDLQAKLESEILDIKGDRSIRIESKRQALISKGLAEQKKANEEIIEGQKKLQEEVDKYREESAEKAKKLLEEELKQIELANEQKWKWQVDLGKALFRQNQQDAEAVWQELLKRDDLEKQAAAKKEDTIQQFKQAGLQGAEMGANAIFEAKKNRLQAEMTAELSNENLTQSQRLSIQKKYAKEQQKIDINQAIINGALAVGNALATTKPFFPAAIIAAALATLQSGIQVATIKAQKFATGGVIKGGLQIHPDTSKDNTLIYVKQGETVLNQGQVARLGGSGAMRKARVPGYAMGGYVGQQAPEIPGSGFDYGQLARLMNSIEVKLDINKVNSAQKEIQVITTPQSI